MFEELLAKIGKVLKKHKIPYMIIGGQAVLLYGEPRLTRDIDITLGINIDRVDEIVEITKGLSLRVIPSDIKSFVSQTMVLPALDDNTGIRVDFIFSFTPYEAEAIKRAKKVRILNQEVSFASVEDLIIHKIFAGRHRDLEDVRVIMIKNPEVDVQYIKKSLKEFDNVSDSKIFQKTFENVLKSKN